MTNKQPLKVPEVTVHERSDLDRFLVMACDGVWDVLSNDEVGSLLRLHFDDQDSNVNASDVDGGGDGGGGGGSGGGAARLERPSCTNIDVRNRGKLLEASRDILSRCVCMCVVRVICVNVFVVFSSCHPTANRCCMWINSSVPRCGDAPFAPLASSSYWPVCLL